MKYLFIIIMCLCSVNCLSKNKSYFIDKYAIKDKYMIKCIDSIKEDYIKDINSLNISDSLKTKICFNINKIKIYQVPNNIMYYITGEYGYLAITINEINKKNHPFIGNNSVIILNSNVKNINTTLRHELSHYIDWTLGNEKSYKSKNNKLTNLLDYYRLSNSNIHIKIATIFFNKDEYNISDILAINYIFTIVNSEYNYYSLSEELFARFQILKKEMLIQGYIKNINDDITIDMLFNFINDGHILYRIANNEIPEYLSTIVMMDWQHLDEINEICKIQ